jgi:hypothetical protein
MRYEGLMKEQRRARLSRRHRLDGSARSAVEAARAVLALHASDPASVFLSVLTRAHDLEVDDILRELYDERALARVMAMRRTLFVVPVDLVPVTHHAASLDVAATIRKRLVKELAAGPTEPVLPEDVESWLSGVEAQAESYVATNGPVDGAAVGAAVPALRTALLPRTTKKYDVRRTITSNVLTLMSTEGRIVRGRPLGSWTSRRHTWEVGAAWWPDGIPSMDKDEARARLVELYLRTFGPATEADVAWWTGWPLKVTRAALAALETADVDGGLVLADDADPVDPASPTAALLPALDPTPMGWKQREWFLPEDASGLYDTNGNIGPTVWWGGEVVGLWAVRPDGGVATRLLVDRGHEAAAAVAEAAERLTVRLDGKVVVPAFRTPWERELSQG